MCAAAVMIMLRKGSSASRKTLPRPEGASRGGAPRAISSRSGTWKCENAAGSAGGNGAAAHEDENIPVKAIGLG